MPPCRISFRDVAWEKLINGYKIVVVTDVPSHLYMRWSLNPPQYHTVPTFRRGIFLHGNRYICFTAYHDNEQEEAGDTLTHTFVKAPWPVCETRHFYFWGSQAGVTCVSTSAVFVLHFTAPPPPIIGLIFLEPWSYYTPPPPPMEPVFIEPWSEWGARPSPLTRQVFIEPWSEWGFEIRSIFLEPWSE